MILRTLHKWLSIVIGLQVAIWVTSGMVISLLDHELVAGRTTKVGLPGGEALGSVRGLVPLEILSPKISSPITDFRLERAFSGWLYRITTTDGVLTFDAQTGRAFRLEKAQALKQAQHSYIGDGAMVESTFLEQGSPEVHKAGAVWRMDFDDAMATRVYVSALDGRVVAHRNRYWKVVDFLLMLHFMDYPRAHHFNNPQIIVIAFLTLWLTISGLILVKRSFTRRDFTWRGLTR